MSQKSNGFDQIIASDLQEERQKTSITSIRNFILPALSLTLIKIVGYIRWSETEVICDSSRGDFCLIWTPKVLLQYLYFYVSYFSILTRRKQLDNGKLKGLGTL